MDKPWSFNLKTKKAFTVISPIDINKAEYQVCASVHMLLLIIFLPFVLVMLPHIFSILVQMSRCDSTHIVFSLTVYYIIWYFFILFRHNYFYFQALLSSSVGSTVENVVFIIIL